MDKKKESVDFGVKAAWLSIAKMYNAIGLPYGISHSIGFVLLNIDREKGTPATKIAPLMGMEARSLSRILKAMEDEGLICRKEDDLDKRKVLVCLTEEGKRRREVSRKVVKEFNGKIREHISNEQLSVFFKVIDTINDIADAYRFPVEEEIAAGIGI